MEEVKVGDRLTFRPVTRWCSTKKVTRTVTGFSSLGWPEVRFGGHKGFVVRWSEITRVNGE